MSDLSKTVFSVFFVSSGAVLGAYLRDYIVKRFHTDVRPKYLLLLLINCIASFLLGLIYALENGSANSLVYNFFLLFICIGLLGSLSTFSSVIWEVSFALKKRNWTKSFWISITSVLGGLLFALAGYRLGNA